MSQRTFEGASADSEGPDTDCSLRDGECPGVATEAETLLRCAFGHW